MSLNNCNCTICNELITGELVLRHFDNFFVVLNRYPYLPGHIMVVSNLHIYNSLDNFTSAQKHELIEIIAWSQNILLNAVNCDSVNIGINIGPHAGGINSSHFHFHIIPRHINDINFMSAITKNSYNTYPQHILELNQRIIHAFSIVTI